MGEQQARQLDWPELMLGYRLGLGNLNAPKPCHQYANACRCEECLERQENVRRPKKRPQQPWEAKAAA